MARDDEELEDVSRSRKDDDGDSGKIGAIVLGILFFPALVIMVSGWWGLLVKLRQRTSVVAAFAIPVAVLTALLMYFYGAFPLFVDTLKDFTNISHNWKNLLPFYLGLNVVIGALGAVYLVWNSGRKMKLNPYRTELEGTWQYKFEYARTPLERFQHTQKVEKLKNGDVDVPNSAPLGLAVKTDEMVCRYYKEAAGQTLITGASGSGKTVTMLSLILSDIKNKNSAIIVDFKESDELSAKVAAWCDQYDRNFYHFTSGSAATYRVPFSSGPCKYDPLINAGDSKPDIILGMREYDTAAAMYRDKMRELLQVLVSMMDSVDHRRTKGIVWGNGSIHEINSALKDENLDDMVADLSTGDDMKLYEDAVEVVRAGRERNNAMKQQIEALRGQMRTLSNSPYSRSLVINEGDRVIDLFNLMKDPGNVVLFSLNADSQADFAKLFGSLIFSDISKVSEMRRQAGMKNQVCVYADEFQAVHPTAVKGLLEKSRQSKMAITLSCQSFDQIITAAEKNGEAILKGILDTCSNFIVHNGSQMDSAVRLSKIIGEDSFPVYKATMKGDKNSFIDRLLGRDDMIVSTDEKMRWIVDPKEFMGLTSSMGGGQVTAMVVKKSPMVKKGESAKASALKTFMIPDKLVLQDVDMLEKPLGESKKSKKRVDDVVLDDVSTDVDYDGEDYGHGSHASEYDDGYDDYPYDESDYVDPYEDAEDRDGGFTFDEVEDEEEYVGETFPTMRTSRSSCSSAATMKEPGGSVSRSERVSKIQESAPKRNDRESVKRSERKPEVFQDLFEEVDTPAPTVGKWGSAFADEDDDDELPPLM